MKRPLPSARQAFLLSLALLCALPATPVYATGRSSESSEHPAAGAEAEAGPSQARRAEVGGKQRETKGKKARTTINSYKRWEEEEGHTALRAGIQYGSRHVEVIAGRTPYAVYRKILSIAKKYGFGDRVEEFLDRLAAASIRPPGLTLSERQQEILNLLRWYQPTEAGVRDAAFMLEWSPELCIQEVAEVLEKTQSGTILEALRKLKGWGLLGEEGFAAGQTTPRTQHGIEEESTSAREEGFAVGQTNPRTQHGIEEESGPEAHASSNKRSTTTDGGAPAPYKKRLLKEYQQQG